MDVCGFCSFFPPSEKLPIPSDPAVPFSHGLQSTPKGARMWCKPDNNACKPSCRIGKSSISTSTNYLVLPTRLMMIENMQFVGAHGISNVVNIQVLFVWECEICQRSRIYLIVRTRQSSLLFCTEFFYCPWWFTYDTTYTYIQHRRVYCEIKSQAGTTCALHIMLYDRKLTLHEFNCITCYSYGRTYSMTECRSSQQQLNVLDSDCRRKYVANGVCYSVPCDFVHMFLSVAVADAARRYSVRRNICSCSRRSLTSSHVNCVVQMSVCMCWLWREYLCRCVYEENFA